MSGRERREQLLDVGRAIFAQKGYEAASVEEIAQRAGVTKPVVYEHFGGKEGLYAVVVDREMRTLLDRISLSLTADRSRIKLERAADAFLSYIEEQPQGFQVLVRDVPAVTSTGTFASLIGDIAAQVEHILEEEFKKRKFETKLAPMYSRALVGMIALVGQWWMETGKPKREVVAAHVVNLAWNGLAGLDSKPVLEMNAKHLGA